MDQIDDQIRAELKRIVGVDVNDRFPIMSGVVKAVNEGEGTCTVVLTIDGDTQTEGILLNAVSGAMNGVVVYPKVNSQCWVAEIDGPGKWGLLRCAEIKKVTIVADVVVEFNGGENGGMAVVGDVAAKINTVINSLNTLRNVMAAWVPVPYDGGAKLKTDLTAAGWLSETLSTVTPSSIENDKVKH